MKIVHVTFSDVHVTSNEGKLYEYAKINVASNVTKGVLGDFPSKRARIYKVRFLRWTLEILSDSSTESQILLFAFR